MKKLMILFLFLIPFVLVSCGDDNGNDIDNDDIQNVEKNKEEANNKEEKKEEQVIKKVADYTNYVECINEFIARFAKIEKYEKISKGKTETWVNQDIDCSVSRDGNKYRIYNTAKSAFKDTYHEAIFEDKVKYKNKANDEFSETTLAEYKKEYGVTPYDNTLFDYVITNDTVSKIERKEENGKYTFTIDLNVNSDATKYIKVQMQKLPELSEYPKFKSIKLTLVIDDDFKPYTGKIESEYDVKYLFLTPSCKQNLDINFIIG